MMKLFLFLLFCFSIEQAIELKDFALKSPFVLGSGSSHGWNYGGSTVLTDDYVRLTPDVPSKSGRVWCNQPLMASEWELVATLRISGKTRGADGMAFWFTRELIQEGRVFGGSDKWHGLMVAVDTYPNVKGKGGYPSVYSIVNDGTIFYDADTDGFGLTDKRCRFDVRGSANPVRLSIRYSASEKKLTVSTGSGESGPLRECFVREGVDLPAGYHIAVSASTGGLSDNHDVYGVSVHQRPAGHAGGGTKGATQPQPQPQPQPPHEQKKVRDIELKELDPKEIKKVDEKIQTELKKLPKLNSQSAEAFLRFLAAQRVSFRDAAQRALDSNRLFASIVKELAEHPPHEFKKELQEISNVLKLLETEVKKVPLAENAKGIADINKTIQKVKEHLDKMHFIASGLIDNLRTETDGSISTISAKSSFVFWVFFVVLQVAFAAGLFFWKGLVNEKKKHF